MYRLHHLPWTHTTHANQTRTGRRHSRLPAGSRWRKAADPPLRLFERDKYDRTKLLSVSDTQADRHRRIGGSGLSRLLANAPNESVATCEVRSPSHTTSQEGQGSGFRVQVEVHQVQEHRSIHPTGQDQAYPDPPFLLPWVWCDRRATAHDYGLSPVLVAYACICSTEISWIVVLLDCLSDILSFLSVSLRFPLASPFARSAPLLSSFPHRGKPGSARGEACSHKGRLLLVASLLHCRGKPDIVQTSSFFSSWNVVAGRARVWGSFSRFGTRATVKAITPTGKGGSGSRGCREQYDIVRPRNERGRESGDRVCFSSISYQVSQTAPSTRWVLQAPGWPPWWQQHGWPLRRGAQRHGSSTTTGATRTTGRVSQQPAMWSCCQAKSGQLLSS